jgi:hypothetical protein
LSLLLTGLPRETQNPEYGSQQTLRRTGWLASGRLFSSVRSAIVSGRSALGRDRALLARKPNRHSRIIYISAKERCRRTLIISHRGFLEFEGEIEMSEEGTGKHGHKDSKEPWSHHQESGGKQQARGEQQEAGSEKQLPTVRTAMSP